MLSMSCHSTVVPSYLVLLPQVFVIVFFTKWGRCWILVFGNLLSLEVNAATSCCCCPIVSDAEFFFKTCCCYDGIYVASSEDIYWCYLWIPYGSVVGLAILLLSQLVWSCWYKFLLLFFLLKETIAIWDFICCYKTFLLKALLDYDDILYCCCCFITSFSGWRLYL